LTGKIVGAVIDEEGNPLPGISLEISSPALMGGVHYLITSEKGAYRLINCPPGIYKIVCKLEGFQTVERENLKVSLGSTVTENIVLKQVALEEFVTVKAESPVVDVTKSSMTVHYDKDQLEKLPVGRFTYFDIVKQIPGFVFKTGLADYQVSAYGANAEENAWLTDGVDLSSPEEGTVWLWQTADIFEEVEVSGIGAPAEYGNFTGAVVNIVTKSGGNRLSGSLSYYGQFDGLTSDNNPEQYNEETGEGYYSYHRDKFYDITFTLGGPITKDRIWFFGAYQKKADSESLWQEDPDFPSEIRLNEQFFKLSTQISSRHRLVLSFYHEYLQQPGSPDPFNQKETICTMNGSTYTWNFLYNFLISNNAYLELKYSGYYAQVDNMPIWGDVNSPIHYDLATGVSSNGPWWPWDFIMSRNQVNANFSYFADDFLGGDHDFKIGIQFNRGTVESWGGYGGGKAYYDYAGYPYLLYEQNINRYGGLIQNIGAFFDDSWKIGERLTINFGLRFDHHDASIPAFSLMDGWTETSEKGKSIDDLIVWNSFSPRIGIAFQLTSDQKTLLRASFGRYYNYPYIGNWESPGPNAPDLYAYWWNGTEWELWLEIPGEMGYTVDPEIKNPYADQFSVGLERELFSKFSVGATLIYRNNKSLIGYKNVTGLYEQVQRISPDNNRAYTVFNQLNPGENDYWLTNPEGWGQTYTGFILNFNKRYSNNWLLNASLTWSKAEGLNLTSYGEGIHAVVWHTGQVGTDPNDLVNAEGPLNLDRTWMFKLSAVYNFPWDILASLYFVYQTGRPHLTYVRIMEDEEKGTLGLDQTPYSFARIIAEPRGSKRFDALTQLDFRIQKTFKLYSSFKCLVFFDVFNLLSNDTFQDFWTYDLWQTDYGVPSQLLRPRRVQVGLKLEF